MRRGSYSMMEKNPPHPLKCSPASRPGDEDNKFKEDEAIPVAVDYATSLTFDDEHHANENNVAAGGNDNNGGDDRGMNGDNGGDDLGMNDDKSGTTFAIRKWLA